MFFGVSPFSNILLAKELMLKLNRQKECCSRIDFASFRAFRLQ